MTRTQQIMGLYNPLGEPRAAGGQWHRRGCRLVHVFLNGMYWGISDLTERLDNDFWATRLNVPKEYKDFEWGSYTADLSKAIEKAVDAWFVESEADPAWIALNKEIEIDQFIDYLLLTWYTGESPEDESSARLVRWKPESLIDPTNDHAWRFFTYDPENAALISPSGSLPLDETGYIHLWQPIQSLFEAFYPCSLFRAHLLDRAAAHLNNNGALTPAACRARWASIQSEVRGHFWEQSARFSRLSEATALTNWQTEMTTVDTFFGSRASALQRNLNNYFLEP